MAVKFEVFNSRLEVRVNKPHPVFPAACKPLMQCEHMNPLNFQSAESIPSSLSENIPVWFVGFGEFEVEVPFLYGSVNLWLGDLGNLNSTHASVS